MRIFIFIFFLLLTISFKGQNNPFEMYGPYNSPVYKDIQTAYKDKESCYKFQLSYLPETEKQWMKFYELTKLQVLKLEVTNLDSLSEKIGLMAQLNYLSIKAPLTSLPSTIGGLQQLRILQLINLTIDSFPPSTKHLYQLEELEIHSNKDSLSINFDISQLTKLNSFLSYRNNFDSITNSLASSNIQSFYFIESTFKKGIDSIPFPLNTRTLVLQKDSLTKFPSNIFQLKSLETLVLKDNLLTEIPEKIGRLKKLTTLDIRGNSFESYQLDLLKALLPNTQILYDPIIEEDE